MDVVEKTKGLQAKAAQKREGKTPNTKPSAQIIQLPLWADKTRGIPNTFARSALFTIGYRRTPRQHFKGEVVAAMGNTVITYTGEELRQDDETVLLQLIHMARLNPINKPVCFTSYSFLKEIRWSTQGQNHYKRFSDCIDRLKANSLKVTDGDTSYGGDSQGEANSLIAKIKFRNNSKNKSKEWMIWIDPEILNLFNATAYSRIEWEQRLELKKPLEQWLHSYYFTHRDPYPMKVKTIHELCGSTAKNLSSFRQKINESLRTLKEIGFLSEWWIDNNDLVHVRRNKALASE